MLNDKLYIKDLFEIIAKYKKQIVVIIFITFGFAMTLTEVLKKQYKSQFEINVYSKYFQNPLISEIIPGVYNIPEMRFTIDSMVKEAINDDFIDEIAREYNVYPEGADEMTIAKKRQLLRYHFNYYPTGGQSYEVTYSDSDPYIAKKIAEKTLERVKAQFVQSRIKTIEMVKQMMIQRLQSLTISQKMSSGGSEKALASKSPEVLKAELQKIDVSIAALTKELNPTHPKIKALNERKLEILNWLEEFKSDGKQDAVDVMSVTLSNDKNTNGQLTSKFYAKYHDFNMALDIEKKSLESYIGVIKRPQLPIEALWPKKRLFASIGFILGLVFAFIYVFVKEMMMPNNDELLKAEALKLETMVLGSFKLTSNDTNNTNTTTSSEKELSQ
jgi:capsular polysaccharide biosynthesis protein